MRRWLFLPAPAALAKGGRAACAGAGRTQWAGVAGAGTGVWVGACARTAEPLNR